MKTFIPLLALCSLAWASPAPLPQYDSCPPCEYFCVQSFPESCYCANAAEAQCAVESPCYVPQIGNCTVDDSAATTPVSGVKNILDYQLCGTRGQAPCPDGSTCTEFPDATCGLACDEPGYCRTETQCGGFAGFECPSADQVCLDDPSDDCDPNNGGADCIGFCFPP